ncbi:internalin-J [Kordia sp. SMS9]|uniref:T9SS type A sorting domain-containing protein n=1 Tax=Kordia sp. SMS9 TaxID=2282170 RepID=UPI000E0DD0CC|nr:T9SS type A sorting domain-containing protein [Kordia sp. SMS9]AXG71438.1 internalin-J [Kordia sp. SMS9]
MKTKLLLILLVTNFISWSQVTTFDNLPTPPRSLQESNGLLYARLNAEIRVWNSLPQNTDNAVVGASTGFADGFVVENDIIYFTDENSDFVISWDTNNFTQSFLGNNLNGRNPDYITIVNGTDMYITAETIGGGGGPKELLLYDSATDSFNAVAALGNEIISGILNEGDIIYIITRAGLLLHIDTSNPAYPVSTLNTNLGNDPHGLEIVNNLIYYTDRSPGVLKTVSKTIVNDTPQTVATGLSLPTDVRQVGNTLYISDRTNNTIYTYVPTCVVNIPDPIFKTALLNHGSTITGANISVIDTNGDGEIQCAEASAYTGHLILNSNVANGISNVTGIEAFTSTPYILLDGQSLVTAIDVSNNTALTFLSIRNNALTSIDISQNTALETLDVAANNLTTLDVSQNTLLATLSIGENNLSSIDLSANPSLDSFFTTGNPSLQTIDFSANANLFRISIDNSAITDLDLSNNSGLGEVEAYDNSNLASVNVANGNNVAITLADFTNNTALSCIQIDTGFTPPSSSWFKDASANYSADCSSLSVDDFNSNNKIKIYPNPAKNNLYIESNQQIETIEIYTLLGEKVVEAKTTTINISNLNSGIYLIKIISLNRNVLTKKFIKN